jgi:hypothetical protein
MAVQGRREAGGRRGASQGFGVETNSRERKAASGPNRRVAVQRKRRERLIITMSLQARRPTALRQGLKLKGSESSESFGKNDASKPVQRSMRRRWSENIKSEINPTSRRNKTPWNRGAAAAHRGNDGEADACRSLLIPRTHFGAAGGAGVLALGAGRFLPLAGPIGSSCA